MPRAEILRIFWLTLAIAFLLALFAAVPEVDIAESRIWFDPATGTFPLANRPWAEALRKAIWNLSIAMVMVALVMGGVSLSRKRAVGGLPSRAWGHILALYAIGPGLLVETLLKGLWGRARPAEILTFGGTSHYTLPGMFSDQCQRNCSFVAGEPAGAMALCLSLLLVIAWQKDRLSPRLRIALTLAAALLPVAASFLRLGAGRHFLSDIAAALLVILLVEAVLALRLRPWPGPVQAPGRGARPAPEPDSGPVDIPRDSP